MPCQSGEIINILGLSQTFYTHFGQFLNIGTMTIAKVITLVTNKFPYSLPLIIALCVECLSSWIIVNWNNYCHYTIVNCDQWDPLLWELYSTIDIKLNASKVIDPAACIINVISQWKIFWSAKIFWRGTCGSGSTLLWLSRCFIIATIVSWNV